MSRNPSRWLSIHPRSRTFQGACRPPAARRPVRMDSVRQLLRDQFLLGYDQLKARLTERLGSAELASEALQDAWLRLENVTLIGPVHRPWPYVLRIAYNIALKRLRREREI